MLEGKVKKDNVIVSRLNDIEYDQLDRFVSKTSEKKSAIIRKALKTYITLKSGAHPHIIWGKNEFVFSLSSMNDSKIKELADLSCDNGKLTLSYMLRDYEDLIDFGDEGLTFSKIPIKILLKALFYILSKGYLNWFDSIDFSLIDKSRKILQIIGNHTCNEKFSIYMKYIMENYLASHHYVLIKEGLFEDKIILEFMEEK